jgi:hypothetical protein
MQTVKRRLTFLLVLLNIIAACSVIAIAAKLVVVPMIAKQVYRDRYKNLVFQCDEVMRDHFIAKSNALRLPSEQSISELRAAEVSLLSCHDYDKLRKRLQTLGLSESELSSLGIEAIEEKAKDVRTFVETHEIRY